jgi:hypothetical protein
VQMWRLHISKCAGRILQPFHVINRTVMSSVFNVCTYMVILNVNLMFEAVKVKLSNYIMYICNLQDTVSYRF